MFNLSIFKSDQCNLSANSPSFRRKSLAAAVAIVAMVNSPVDVLANEPSLLLEEVVVTARKREESLMETPVSVTAFSRNDLSELQVDSVDQIADSTPNFVFKKESASGAVAGSGIMFIRGIGQTDFVPTSEPGVGLYIDGAYMSQSIGSVLDLVDIESIQVLRGPQGTLFGRNTIGGAILINTKKPEEELAGSIEGTIGSRDRLGAKVNLNLPLTDNLFASVSLMRNRQDGYIRQPFRSGEGGNTDVEAGRLALRWLATDNLDINFTADFSSSESHGQASVLAKGDAILNPSQPGSFVWVHNNIIVPMSGFMMPVYNEALVDAGRYTSLGTSDSSSETDVWGTGLTIEWDFGEMTLKSISSYREIDASGARDDDHSPLTIIHPHDELASEEWSQELQLSGTAFDGRMEWITGLYYGEVDAYNDNFMVFSPLSLQAGSIVENSSQAVFGQLTYDLTDELSVTIGARYTEEDKVGIVDERLQYVVSSPFPPPPGPGPARGQFNPAAKYVPNGRYKSDFEEFDPYLNFAYQWSEDLMTYFTYSEGFKGGGWVQRNAAVRATLPSFEPETTSSYELGFKLSTWDSRLRMNGAIFYTDYDDIQINIDQPGLSASIIQNGGAATITGGELEITALLSEQLKVIFGASYLDFEWDDLSTDAIAGGITKNANLPFASDWQLSSSLVYDFPMASGDLRARLDWSYRTEHYFEVSSEPTSEVQSGYGLVNAAVIYTPSEGDWEFALMGKNLGDKYYYSNIGSTQAGEGYSSVYIGTPREWSLRVKYNF